jgi:hypothetical protein
MIADKDKNTQKRIRFNILDAIIILLVVLCIVGISFRYSIMRKLGLSEELTNYRISFKLTTVSYTLPGFLNDGDKLYLIDGTEVGELLGVSEFSNYTSLTAENETLILSQASKYVNNSDGTLVLAYYPEYTYVDANGAFLCRGAYGDKGYFCLAGETYLAVGQKLTLYTDTVTLNMTITGITQAP